MSDIIARIIVRDEQVDPRLSIRTYQFETPKWSLWQRLRGTAICECRSFWYWNVLPRLDDLRISLQELVGMEGRYIRPFLRRMLHAKYEADWAHKQYEGDWDHEEWSGDCDQEGDSDWSL